MNTKKIVIVVVLALILAAGAYYFLTNRRNRIAQSEVPQVTKTNVDFSEAPAGFPVNVPIEPGAKLTQNYSATTQDGRFQATRVFETTKSLDANYEIYVTFLEKDGWQAGSALNNPTYKVITGTKGLQNLQVVIDENKVNKIKTVSITFTEAN